MDAKGLQDQSGPSRKKAAAAREEWECFDIFGFPECRKLRPGVLDEDAEWVFTHGHCHSFAEALHRLKRAAELVFAFDFLGEGEESEGVQGHVLVRIDGRYLDARGWIDELEEGSQSKRAFECGWDRVLAIEPQGWRFDKADWLTLRVGDATPYAAALLQGLAVPIDSRPGNGRGGGEACGCTGS